jgi:hypothetical protein
MRLKTVLFVFLASAVVSAAVSAVAQATAPINGATTLYYLGEAITTRGSEVTRHPYLVERITDPGMSTISENVVSFHESGYNENRSVLKIEDGRFTMTESTGTVTGDGTLTGLPWNWTFLRAEFKIEKYKMRIVDYNFLGDPAAITAHKDYYLNVNGNESLFMQEDVSLHVVEKLEFDAKRAELLKK